MMPSAAGAAHPGMKGHFQTGGQSPVLSAGVDPFRAATGEDLFVLTSEFSAENIENPRVCPAMTKSFASVEK